MPFDYRDDLRADILPSYTDSLMHHGIKGQKWGVRRPRNEAGILQGAGAKLAAKQNHYKNKAHKNTTVALASKRIADNIQRDADAHGAKARATKNIFKKAGHRVAQAWDTNAANTWRDSEKHYRKKAAKAQLKADRIQAKRDLQDWGEKANRGYAKNHDDKRMARSAEQAIDRFNAANRAAKSRYKQVANADKIAKAQKKQNKAQRKANYYSHLDKMVKNQGKKWGVAGQAFFAPTRGAAKVHAALNQRKANKYSRRVNRLSN